MLKQLTNNKQGVVFVTVLMTIIVLMVLTMSTISMNISQIASSEEELRRVQAQAFAIGALYYMLANQISTSPGSTMQLSEVIGSYTFNADINIVNDGSGPFSTDPVTITVTAYPN